MVSEEYIVLSFTVLLIALHLLNHLYHSVIKTYYFSVSVDDIAKNNGILKHTWYTDIEIFAQDFAFQNIEWDAVIVAKQRSSLYVYKHYEMHFVPITLSDYDNGEISQLKYRNGKFKYLDNKEWKDIPEYYIHDFEQFFKNVRTFKSE
jgi:hypothetical protein